MNSPHQEAIEFPHAGDWCQRWRDRTPTWLRTSEGGFDPGVHRVIPIDEVPARRFVERHHYSASWPAVRFSLALQRIDQPPEPGDPKGGRLLGVLTLGIPMNGASLNCFADLRRYEQSLELNRLVLLDEAASNAESWLCARAFHYASERGIRGVIAYSDPYPRTRTTATGTELVSPGHIGHIYAAQDFAYLGRTRPRRLTILPDATVLPDRAANKVKRDECGHRGVERRLQEFGAPARHEGEAGDKWLSRALEAIGATSFPHGGNHRYARTIGPRRTRIRLVGTRYPRPTAPSAAS